MNEDLTRRRDAANAAIGFGNLEETKTHNRATEQETSRHNLAQESLDSERNEETARANRAREAYQASALQESVRHSLATEAIQSREADIKDATQRETSRHNIAQEEETSRSNRVREAETERANRAAQSEISRHNIETEKLGKDQLSLGYAELSSLDRYRNQSLSLEADRIAETQRSNLARELETRRHNVIGEAVSRAGVQEQARHNVAAESNEVAKVEETHRHNRRNEQIAQVRTGVEVLGSAVDNYKSLMSGGIFR